MATLTTVEGIINHFLLVMISDPAKRERMGLRYISHMWDSSPFWYIWLSECPGVYKLSLRDVSVEPPYDWVALCDVKYYPSKNEEWFSGLSILEQMCRKSEVFHTHPADGCGCPIHAAEHDGCRFTDIHDETGAPGYPHSAYIPPQFFEAGQIYIAHLDGKGTMFRIKSQTSWKVTMAKDYYITNHQRHSFKVLRKGETDRDYPGYEITRFLCERLVSGWSLFHTYPVRHEMLWKGAGLEFFSDGSSLQAVASQEIERLIAHIELKACDEPLPWLEDDDIALLRISERGEEGGCQSIAQMTAENIPSG